MDWLFNRRTVELDPSRLPPFDYHYNAGLFIHPNGKPHVVMRCHNANTAFDTGFWHACKRSQLWVAELDPETYQPVNFRNLDIPLINCEDPRVVVHDGQIYVFFTHFSQGSGQKYDPHVAIFDADFEMIELRPIGLFGRGECEKNWQFFRHKNAWHASYSIEPWQVVCFDDQWRGYLIHKTKIKFKFGWGDLRGGTPPVLVDGSFWTWFHAVLVHPNANRRVYTAGCLRFEGDTPYTPTGVSLYPLIHPDLDEEGWVGYARVVFPCGAIFDDAKREWAVSYGKNDSTTCIDFIPHERVVSPWLWCELSPGMTLTGGIGGTSIAGGEASVPCGDVMSPDRVKA